MADSRDMYVIHSAFRREFPAAPALVRAARDRAAVNRVADHIMLITGILDLHHTGEDEMVWPKLLERGADEIAPLVETMEKQHAVLHHGLIDVEARTATWRQTGRSEDGEALARAIEAVVPPMLEHLATEEEHLLALIDKHLTDEEWAEVGSGGMGKAKKSQLPVIFGMVLRDGRPEHVATLKAVIPAPAWFIMSRLGPRAYDRYTRRLAA